MMTAIVGLVLFLVAIMLRQSDHSIRYITLALASIAVLVWAISFDFISGKDVVRDAVAYKRFLLLCAAGATTALAGLILSIWCSDKPVRYLSRCLAAVAFVMCAAGILTPY